VPNDDGGCMIFGAATSVRTRSTAGTPLPASWGRISADGGPAPSSHQYSAATAVPPDKITAAGTVSCTRPAPPRGHRRRTRRTGSAFSVAHDVKRAANDRRTIRIRVGGGPNRWI